MKNFILKHWIPAIIIAVVVLVACSFSLGYIAGSLHTIQLTTKSATNGH